MLEINVREVNEIDGGVEVFASATRDGNPIGFGKDGSVEIERFRIFNPPVMVPDGTTHTVEEYDDDGTTLLLTYDLPNYREDPEEALLQVLEHNISVVGKDGSNIVPGKRGNTTSTFYPDADGAMGATTFDGACEQRNATWATAQTSTTSNNINDSATTLAATQGVGVRNTGTEYRIERTFTLFDTSAIGATDTINSATVSLYGTVVVNQANTGGDTVFPTLSSPASDTAIASGDFDNCGSVASPTQGATPIDLSAISTSGYNDWSLNATGLTWIARSGESIGGGGGTAGITYLGWRLADDDTADPSYGTARNTMNAHSADNAGGDTQAPKLVVEHSAASSGQNSAFLALMM